MEKILKNQMETSHLKMLRIKNQALLKKPRLRILKKKTSDPKGKFSKSPATYDAGIGGYLGLGGLASAAFAFLQRKKKDDENDKEDK